MKNYALLFLILFTYLQTISYANDSFSETSKETISIQLKWEHSFQFAGYYAAIEKGFYADEGLKVTLKELDHRQNHIQSVLNGASEYGVSDSSLVVSRLQDNPVVLVTQIFQYSPLVLISHRDSNITTPYDMTGKKMMYSVNGTGETPFKALILKTIGSFDKISISSFTAYQDFIDRKVDVTSAYSTSQPYWLKKQGIEVNIIDPKSYGIDFYGDNLFTTQTEVKNHPLRVRKIKKATLKGWQYALSHQDEMIDIILKKYAPNKKRDSLEFEARGTYQMIMPDLIDLGTFRKEKYAQVAKTYQQLGIVKNTLVKDDFFYHDSQEKALFNLQERLWIKNHPIVKVGGGPDWAPFDFVNSSGKYDGISNDYLKILSQKTGLEFKVIIDKWANNLQKMKEQKIDLLHAVYYTKERDTYMHYTQSYFEMLNYFFIRDDLDVKTLKDLNGKRVAMPKGYAHEEILKQEFPQIKIVTVDTFSDAIDAVLVKKADILFDTYAALSYKLKQEKINTIVPFKAYRGKHIAKLHMASHKTNPTLAHIIDKGLAQITKLEKEKIYSKWLTKNHTNLHLTPEEKKWLKNNPMIKLAIMSYWEVDAEHNNLHTDLIKLLNRYGNLNIIPVAFNTWEDGFQEAISGENIHGILNLSYSQEREKSFLYTQAYDFTPNYLIVREDDNETKSVKDLKNKTIYLKKKHISHAFVNDLSFPINVIDLQTDEEIYKKLSHNHNVIATISDIIDNTLLKKYHLKVSKTFYNSYSATYIGLSHKYPQLQSILNKVFHIIPKEELTNLQNKVYKKTKEKTISLTKEEKAWIQSHPTLLVAAKSSWAPFEFVNKTDHYDGFTYELLKLIEHKTGLKFSYKIDSWENSISKIKNNKIDILTSIVYTKESSTFLDFTKPYYKTFDYFFTHTDLTIETLDDLNDKIVAVPKGSHIKKLLQQYYPKIKILEVASIDKAIEALLAKKANILVGTYAVLDYTIKQKGIQNIKPFRPFGYAGGQLRLATNKKNPLLVSILDKALSTISTKEKNSILSKWIDIKKQQIRIKFTKKEEAWLNQTQTITFAGNPDWLPFEAFDNGKYIGIVADYLHHIEQLTPIMFNPIQTKDWSETMTYANKGDVDIISDDIHSKTLQKHYTPIPAYIKSPIVIVMNSEHGFVADVGDIKDKKIALIKDYSFNDKLKSAYPNQKFLFMKNADIALTSLAQGNIDAVLLTMPRASYLLSSQGYTNLKIVGKTTVNLALTFFVHKNKPILHAILQKSIQALSNTKNLEILSKWQKVEFAKKVDYTLLFQIAGLLGFFLLGTLYWNRKLSREIESRKKVESALASAKKEAELANRAKSEFLANMSHEIRTPMNSILGFSELLAKQISDPVQKDYLDSIQRSGDTLLNIINDILDLSKIEAGKLEIVLESVDIQQLALEMESIFSVNLIQKNIHFELDIDPSLPKYVLLDNTRVRQILFNLISNAIKFTPHGFVKLRIKKLLEDEEKSKIDLEISVEDSGIGIQEENITQIFDAFEQQKGQDTHKYGGTGLGLAISKKLTIMMGGSISVESTVGKGSKFTIKLSDIPISSVEATTVKKKQRPREVVFDKATIMIVDDIKDNRKLVASILKEHNLEFIEAVNGKEAIELLENIKVDLIFMDIKMPVMDGYTATKIIKEDSNLKNIPIIALTASVMGKDLERIKECHFDGYLRKPISEEDLLIEMAKFLSYATLENLIPEQNEVVDVSTYKHLPKVISLLEGDYTKRYNEIKEMGDFTLISEFAEALEKISEEHGIKLLKNYAKELKVGCDSFDIDKVDFLMYSFPSLIEKLQGVANE